MPKPFILLIFCLFHLKQGQGFWLILITAVSPGSVSVWEHKKCLIIIEWINSFNSESHSLAHICTSQLSVTNLQNHNPKNPKAIFQSWLKLCFQLANQVAPNFTTPGMVSSTQIRYASQSSTIPDLLQMLESVPIPFLGHSLLNSKWGIWSYATKVFMQSYRVILNSKFTSSSLHEKNL